MAGPDCGTYSSPSIFGRPRMVSNGPRKMYFKSQYAIEPPTQPRQQCSAPRLPIECVWDHSTRTPYQTLSAYSRLRYRLDSCQQIDFLFVDGDGDGLIASRRAGVGRGLGFRTAAPPSVRGRRRRLTDL